MRYSTGLANRVLVGGCGFQADEREGRAMGRQCRQHGACWTGLVGRAGGAERGWETRGEG